METATIRLVIALANHFDWEMNQLYVEQAFAQSELDFTIFMRLPFGCGTMSSKVVRLKRSLHGLKQAVLKASGVVIGPLRDALDGGWYVDRDYREARRQCSCKQDSDRDSKQYAAY